MTIIRLGYLMYAFVSSTKNIYQLLHSSEIRIAMINRKSLLSYNVTICLLSVIIFIYFITCMSISWKTGVFGYAWIDHIWNDIFLFLCFWQGRWRSQHLDNIQDISDIFLKGQLFKYEIWLWSVVWFHSLQ